MKLIYVPSLDNLYLRNWNTEIPQLLSQHGFDVSIAEGKTEDERIRDVIKNLGGSRTVFFADLHSLGVLRVRERIFARHGKHKIVGYLHTGAWDRFSKWRRRHQSHWIVDIEQAIIKASDLVLVPTQYHQSIIHKARCSGDRREMRKIHIGGFPIFHTPKKEERENVIITLERGKIKRHDTVPFDYDARYEQYAKSVAITTMCRKVQFNPFLFEALQSGCIPILPRASYYPYVFPPELIYDRAEDIRGIVERRAEILPELIFDFDRPKKKLVTELRTILGG